MTRLTAHSGHEPEAAAAAAGLVATLRRPVNDMSDPTGIGVTQLETADV